MFMTGCVALVMSRCQTKTSQTMSYLHSKCHNWANDTSNMHKICHVMIMKMSC